MQISDLTDVGTVSYREGLVLRAAGFNYESSTLYGSEIFNNLNWIADIVEDTSPQLGGDLDGRSLYDLVNMVAGTFSGTLTTDDLTLTGDAKLADTKDVAWWYGDIKKSFITTTASGGTLEIYGANDVDIEALVDDVTIVAADDINMTAGDDINMTAADDFDFVAGGPFQVKTSGDSNDYVEIKTISHVPEITTVGTCELKLSNSLGAPRSVTVSEMEDAHDHISNNGSDHSFIDQSVVSGATPTFSADNFSDGGSNAIVTTTQETNWDNHIADNTQAHSDYLLNTADTMTGTFDLDGKLDLDVTTTTSVGDGINAVFKNEWNFAIWTGTQTALNFQSIFQPDTTDRVAGDIDVYGCYGLARVARDNVTGVVRALGAFYGSCQTTEIADGGAITVTNANVFYAGGIVKDADDTITTATGMYIAAQTVGGTNYGLYVAGAVDSTSAYFEGDISADDVTDRTPAFMGTSREALNGILGIRKDAKGKIDHNTLPDFARKTMIEQRPTGEKQIVTLPDGTKTEEDITKPTEIPARSLGAMITLHTEAIKQLKAEIDILKAA